MEVPWKLKINKENWPTFLSVNNIFSSREEAYQHLNDTQFLHKFSDNTKTCSTISYEHMLEEDISTMKKLYIDNMDKYNHIMTEQNKYDILSKIFIKLKKLEHDERSERELDIIARSLPIFSLEKITDTLP